MLIRFHEKFQSWLGYTLVRSEVSKSSMRSSNSGNGRVLFCVGRIGSFQVLREKFQSGGGIIL